MADSKITALTALTAADPANDMIPIVDVSDTPPASGNTKRISINNILACSPSATLASATISGDLTVRTNRLATTTTGVGIGTASPTSDLDIFRASGSGITSGISLRTAAGAGGDGSFIKWLSAGTNEKVAQIDGVLNGTDLGYLSFQCGNGADAMAEQYRIASTGIFTWYDGAGGTRMTLNANGLGIGVTPTNKLEVVAPAGDNIVSTFRSGDATAANNAGGGFRSISSATAASRVAQVWLDADGANFSGGDYFIIQKNGNSGTVEFNQSSNAAMTFLTNSTERMRIDSSGNVGIGVTPSATNSTYFQALEIARVGQGLTAAKNALTGSPSSWLSNNSYATYSSGVVWNYAISQPAAQYRLFEGQHQWFNAPSGTAGTAITFTQAMTLDASGNLILLSSNTPATLTTNGQLTVNATSNTNLRFSYRGSDGVTRTANITLA